MRTQKPSLLGPMTESQGLTRSPSNLNVTPHTVQVPRFEQFLHRLGAPFHEQLATTRDGFILLGQVLVLFPQLNAWRWKQIAQSIVHIGVHSLPIIVVATVFAGLMITDEIAWHMQTALHAISMIPGFTGQFILRELGVAIPAMLLVSKVGAAITAEVGSMKITEQIDALRLLRINPISYLVFPRFIASLLSGACLTLIATGVTLSCAIEVAVDRYNFSALEYVNALRHFIGPVDVICALVKGTAFGAVIPIVSCAYGFRCKGGAEGVGKATTNSVVAASMVIIMLDFVLTYVFTFFL